MVGELRKSLADCDEVIKRNPYHFGALAGYAQIYIRLEYYDRALDYSRRALDGQSEHGGRPAQPDAARAPPGSSGASR